VIQSHGVGIGLAVDDVRTCTDVVVVAWLVTEQHVVQAVSVNISSRRDFHACRFPGLTNNHEAVAESIQDVYRVGKIASVAEGDDLATGVRSGQTCSGNTECKVLYPIAVDIAHCGYPVPEAIRGILAGNDEHVS